MSEALFTALRRRDAAGVSSLARGEALEAFDEEGGHVLGATPLMVALLEQAWEFADLLVQRGASVEGHSEEGLTPLVAVQGSPVAAAATKWLLGKGANVNARAGRDGTSLQALHAACECADADSAALLLAAGADLRGRDEAGRTPLHVACEEHEFPVVRALLEKGSLVGAVDEVGATPLHLAAAGTDDPGLVEEVLKALVQAGAKLDVKDAEGRTAWDRARQARQPFDVMVLLGTGDMAVPFSESLVPMVLMLVFGFMAAGGLFAIVGALGADLSRLPFNHPSFPGFVFALLISLVATAVVPVSTKGLAGGAKAPRQRWNLVVLGVATVLVGGALPLSGALGAAGVALVMALLWLIGRAGLPRA